MVKNARREGRSPSASPSLYLYIWEITRALSCPFVGRMLLRPYPDGRLFSSEWVGAYCIRPIGRPRQGDECGFWVVSQGDLLGIIRALPFVCQGVGASPHQPPPPFLVLTQEKAPAGAGKFAWYIRRDRVRDEIRKTCVATLRFGHSDFRARPCNSSFRALGDRCRSSGRTMVDGWSDG